MRLFKLILRLKQAWTSRHHGAIKQGLHPQDVANECIINSTRLSMGISCASRDVERMKLRLKNRKGEQNA